MIPLYIWVEELPGVGRVRYTTVNGRCHGIYVWIDGVECAA